MTMTDPRTAIENLARELAERGVTIQPLTGSVAPDGDENLKIAALRYDDAFWAFESNNRESAGRLAEATMARYLS
jgi:hypothetical protein